MVKRKFSSEKVAVSRRIVLTGAAASTSAFILAACGGAVDEGPVPTVTRVPAEGAPPTQPPREEPAATPGGEATPGATEAPSASTPADTGATGATDVGPLYAIDIGWRLGDLSTLNGDEIVLTVTPGTTFEMISEGAAEHDFVVDELGIDVPVAPGETVEVAIPEDAAPGEYKFYCSVPGHEAAGMVGTLVVEEGGAAEAPAEEEEPAEEPAEEEAAAPAAETTVGPLIAIDIGWQLGDLSTLAGDAITLTVSPGTTFDMISEGAAEHDFVVDELGIEVPVAPGETVQVTIPDDAALGEYEFYCSIPGHAAAGMVGTLVVEEGGAAAPAEEEEPAEEPAEEETSDDSAAAPAAGATEVGPLIAIDIGWVLGDLSTLQGDAITLTVAPGTTFDMINEGAAEHDFVVDELGVGVHAAPGETVQVTIPDNAAPGEYKFYCSIPGHEAAGMYGTLLVQEGGAAAEEPAAEDDAASEEPADDAPAAASGGTEVGPLIAIDIGWVLGDLSTLQGDAITLTVAPGTTFDMISEGAAEHDFVVDELDLLVPVAPGETVQVTIPEGAAPGEYKFYCSIAGHEAAGMVGTLVVEEGGGPAEAPADEEGASDEAVPAATPAATPADSGDAAGGAEVGPLIAIDIGWELDDLSTLRGDSVTLTVSPGTTFEMISEGAAEHDFVVDELGVEVAVAPGETVEVTIPEDAAAGEYEFYCSIPGHAAAGMVGTLVVQ